MHNTQRVGAFLIEPEAGTCFRYKTNVTERCVNTFGMNYHHTTVFAAYALLSLKPEMESRHDTY